MTSLVWKNLNLIKNKDPTGNIVKNGKMHIFCKEFYSCKSIGGSGHLIRHMQVFMAKLAGGNVNSAEGRSGT